MPVKRQHDRNARSPVTIRPLLTQLFGSSAAEDTGEPLRLLPTDDFVESLEPAVGVEFDTAGHRPALSEDIEIALLRGIC